MTEHPLPEAAVEAAYLSLDETQLQWLASAPPGRRDIAQAALAAAQPHIEAACRKRWEEAFLSKLDEVAASPQSRDEAEVAFAATRGED